MYVVRCVIARVVEAVDDVFTGEATPYEPEALIGLVQFVDLGPDGNSFLRSCGAKGWPTPAQLAEALVIDFESYQVYLRLIMDVTFAFMIMISSKCMIDVVIFQQRC